ncbi:MAG: hypothetical protein H6Q18_71 [Bacteroidetes bacterium]|nr:hypothetical protein [Bacteroidota bacterium]
MPIEEKSRKYINFLVVATYVLFFGFRGFVGFDWVNYYPFFKEIDKLSDFKFETISNDVGFSVFASFIKTVNPDYSFFILINTIVNVILLHYFFKRYLPTRYYAFAFALFVAIGGIILELNLMRNVKSYLLFLISILYIEKRKPLPYFLLNLLGFLFHWSSLIFFPLYFFIHKKNNIRLIIIAFLLGNIIYLSQIEYITPFVNWLSSLFGEVAEGRTTGYLASTIYGRQYGLTFGYIERFFTFILVLAYYNKLIANSKSSIIFTNCFFIYIFVNLYFSEINIIITRIGILFIFPYWILWPKILENSKIVEKIALFVIFSLYMNVRLISQTNNPMYKYENVLSGKSASYNEKLKVYNIENRKILKQAK